MLRQHPHCYVVPAQLNYVASSKERQNGRAGAQVDARLRLPITACPEGDPSGKLPVRILSSPLSVLGDFPERFSKPESGQSLRCFPALRHAASIQSGAVHPAILANLRHRLKTHKVGT
jgi:hypothetical protein